MHELTSRERIFKAINHQNTDRVPVDFWARNDVIARLMKYVGVNTVEELYQKLGIDLRRIPMDEYIPRFESRVNGVLGGNSACSGQKYIMYEDGRFEDGWGIVRRQGKDGLYDEWVSGPFVENMDLDSFEWPDLDIFDSVKTVRERILAYENKYVLLGKLNLPFKVCWHMRGFENYLCDMLIDPDYAGKLLRRVAAYEKERGLRYIRAGIDIVAFEGDIAMQDRMLVKTDAWRSIEKPVLAELINAFKAENPNIIIYFHSDGCITEVLPDLVEIGVNIVNPIQPECMDPAEVKRLYGDRITMHGSISIQRTLPKGTVEDVKNEVRQRIETCGQNGGLILCPSNLIQNDTPMENILAIYEEALGKKIV